LPDWIEEEIPRTLRARGAAMHEASFNPTLIRVVLIVLFLIITQVLRARKLSKTSTPALEPGTAKASPLELMREAMQK
jgi:hypothetical protein